jgi:hypothetical protein
VQGSGRGLKWCTIPEYSLRNWVTHEKTPVRIVRDPSLDSKWTSSKYKSYALLPDQICWAKESDNVLRDRGYSKGRYFWVGYLTRLLLSILYRTCHRILNEVKKSEEWKLSGKLKTFASATLSTKIPYLLTWDRIRTVLLGRRWLAAWTTSLPREMINEQW